MWSLTSVPLNNALSFFIPISGNVPHLCTSAGNIVSTFLLHILPTITHYYSSKPENVAVFWDVSLSSDSRNKVKELEFLQKYVETNNINNSQVRVFSEGLPAYELDSNAKKIRQLGLENDGKARQLARYVKETGERYVDNLQVMMIYRNDRFLRAGDHTPYVINGYAAIRITEMNENYYHQHQDVRKENNIQYGDLPQYMDFEYLRKNTCLNLSNLANLAKAPAMPQDVKIDVKQLGNFTNMHWAPPKTGKPKGYFVLARETTSAVWQKKIFTAETNIVLPYSKDNYFFAVQSVNETGNESLPVVPDAER